VATPNLQRRWFRNVRDAFEYERGPGWPIRSSEDERGVEGGLAEGRGRTRSIGAVFEPSFRRITNRKLAPNERFAGLTSDTIRALHLDVAPSRRGVAASTDRDACQNERERFVTGLGRCIGERPFVG
jgi:hypothetical protein